MNRASVFSHSEQPSFACAYYRHRGDGNLWAIRMENGRIVKAVGPLPFSATTEPPMHWREPATTDLAGWDLAAFELVGQVWTVKGQRLLPPGLTQPGQRKIIQTANSFSIGLVDRV